MKALILLLMVSCTFMFELVFAHGMADAATLWGLSPIMAGMVMYAIHLINS